ncbi:restriction endonuclease [Streptomyces sp. NPDC059875]|uniref:restriction endonuclease n=1 Tax=unclassified Streptomyces TaxID=2593676 RepID=UPI003668BFB2
MGRRRRLRLRSPRGRIEIGAAVLIALAGISLVVRVLRWVGEQLVRGWPVVAAVSVLGVGVAVWRAVLAARERTARSERLAVLRYSVEALDAMDDRQFEFALRDLLIRDGWSAQQVGQQGDQAADVIGDHPQFGRLVVQAKHTKVAARVGSQVMYQVKGTAGPAHGANAATVVTNGGFTRDAMAWGERHEVGWVDRERLREWAERGVPLHRLLRLPALARRRLLLPRGPRSAALLGPSAPEGRVRGVR